MSSLGLNPALLYKTAVFINAISIPGHVALGLQLVHPGLNAIASSKTAGADESGKKVAVKRSAQACFNYINGSLLIAALLNWQWARTGGPKTTEEKAIFWTLVVNGLIDGATYISGGLYAPLGCMWVAPLCSVAAYLSQP